MEIRSLVTGLVVVPPAPRPAWRTLKALVLLTLGQDMPGAVWAGEAWAQTEPVGIPFEVGVLAPGPRVGGVENTGWIDILSGISAHGRA